jgi:hypothetical protein
VLFYLVRHQPNSFNQRGFPLYKIDFSGAYSRYPLYLFLPVPGPVQKKDAAAIGAINLTGF